MRVAAKGGKPEAIITVKAGESAHGPQALPDGQSVLFTVASATGSAERWDKANIVVENLKSHQRKTLIEGGSDGRYVPTGHIVYALAGNLLAVPFDLKKLEVLGGPVPIVEGVRAAGANTGSAHFSFSDTGALVYIPGTGAAGVSIAELALVLDQIFQTIKIAAGPILDERTPQIDESLGGRWWGHSGEALAYQQCQCVFDRRIGAFGDLVEFTAMEALIEHRGKILRNTVHAPRTDSLHACLFHCFEHGSCLLSGWLQTAMQCGVVTRQA
jgi:hypothetical protein